MNFITRRFTVYKRKRRLALVRRTSRVIARFVAPKGGTYRPVFRRSIVLKNPKTPDWAKRLKERYCAKVQQPPDAWRDQ